MKALSPLSASNGVSSSYYIGGNTTINSVTASNAYLAYLDFNTSSAQPSWKNGRVYWNDADGALSVYNSQFDISLQLGQESYVRARNQTGATVFNGSVVRLSGAVGDRPSISLAQAVDDTQSSVPRKSDILGIATHDILNGADGFITSVGVVHDVDTSAFEAGDMLWVSQSAGKFTNLPPPAPYDKTFVGIVTRKNANNGSIFVKPSEALHFHDLSDVSSSTYSNGNLWVYRASGSSGVWTNSSFLSGAYGITGSLNVTNNISASSVTGNFSGSFVGNGSSLIGLPITNFSTRTEVSGAITASLTNVAYKNQANIYSANQTVTGNVYVSNSVSSSFFVGDGSGLINIVGAGGVSATAVSGAITASLTNVPVRTEVSGAITASLTNVAYKNQSNSFTADQIISGNLYLSSSAAIITDYVRAQYISDNSVNKIHIASTGGSVRIQGRNAVDTSSIGVILGTDRPQHTASRLASFRNYDTEQLAVLGEGSIVSNRGTSSTDTSIKVGTTLDSSSVSSSASLFKIATGIGASEKTMFNVFQSGTGPAATTGLIPGLNFVIYDDSVARITLDNVTNYQGAVALSSRSPATSSTIGTVFKTDRTIDGASKISSFRNYATEQLAINHRGDIVSNRGTGSTEVAVKLGSTIDAAGISDGAKLLSISTGITGSNEKEHIYFTKGSGSSFGAGMVMEITPSLHGYISVLPLLGGLGFGVKEGGTYLLFNYNNGAAETFYGFTARNAGGTYFARIGTDAAATYPNTTASYGRFDQYGTDSSATPGNATINRPTGISAIPVGSSSVTITNSIAYANSRINLTWLGDTGAARTWVTRATGSFTVNISAPSTANAAFSWEVASLLP